MKTRLLKQLRKEARKKYFIVELHKLYYVMVNVQGEIYKVTSYPQVWSDAKRICDMKRDGYIRQEVNDRYKRVY